jgi:CheY-like chemotaxis protein
MTHKINILIIDDEVVSRYTMETLLEDEQHIVFFAEDGLQGLEKAETLHPDIIFLDVMMPGINGFEVCRRLRAMPNFLKLPIIMITAWDDPVARQRCLDVGANQVICKPFNRTQLHEHIRQLFAPNPET